MAGRTGPRDSTWGHGKEILLDAAREVFAEKGYARGGIRDIALQADITEPMIYKYFGSKKKLFEQATVEPFTRYITSYFEQWAARPPASRTDVEESVDFLTGLYDVLFAERKLLIAMVAVREFDPEFTDGPRAVEEAFDHVLSLFEDLVVIESAKRGYRQFDSHIWVRLVFGAVFTQALHGSLLNSGTFLARDALVAELAQMTIRGAQPIPAQVAAKKTAGAKKAAGKKAAGAKSPKAGAGKTATARAGRSAVKKVSGARRGAHRAD